MAARKRKENETFKAYRQNLKNEENIFKSRMPNILWNSGRGTAHNIGYDENGRVTYQQY